MSTSMFDDLARLSQEVQPFRYRIVAGLEADLDDPSVGAKASLEGEPNGSSRNENAEAIRRAFEAEVQSREKRAREQGIKEGQAALRAEVDREISAFRDSLALALKQFAAEREEYYHSVEGQVVNLALAIARKILHREAQVDPLLLAGAVRVALEKVSSATLLRLYVHPDQVQTWKEFLDRHSDMRQKPEILGDAAVIEGQCRIESSLGTADLNLENQITEIEQGFFDLLARRPEIQ